VLSVDGPENPDNDIVNLPQFPDRDEAGCWKRLSRRPAQRGEAVGSPPHP
jgi:hypothetical protein